LIGTYNGGEVNFAHAAALIRVTYTDVPSYASKFMLKTKNKITGEFTVDANNTINTDTSDDGDAVTIKFSQDEVVDGTITFDIPVPVGEYEFFAAYLLSDEDAVISSKTANAVTINRQDILLMPSIAAESYVVETIKPSIFDDKASILYTGFDISQVSAVYIDDIKQDEVDYCYTLDDTKEYTVKIVMSDNFTSTYYMFAHNAIMTSLDLSHLDTSNVTTMGWMFFDSTSLKSIDLSHLNTSKVTDMTGMFYGCSKLVEIKMTGDINDGIQTNAMFDEVPTLGTFYYPASKKDQYAKFFDDTNISGWKQVDIETGDIIKDGDTN
jgi:surface protein